MKPRPLSVDTSTWHNLVPPGLWQANNRQLLFALGILNNRLPDEGVPLTQVGNVRVMILPKGQKWLNQNTRMPRRTLAECPHCLEFFCAGHLNQHLKACPQESR